MGHLTGRRIVVTGAGGGLGRAIARACAREGAELILSDLDADSLAEIAAAIGGAETRTADLGDPAHIAAFGQTLGGPIHGLVDNGAIATGIGGIGFEDIGIDSWDRVMQVNVRGTWLMIRALAPLLRASGSGRIVNVASDTALWGAPNLMSYISSKGAIIAMTRGMARELGPDGDAVGVARLEALALLQGLAPEDARLTVTFHFGWTPEAFLGGARLCAARFRRAGTALDLPCDAAVTAIGFDDDGALDRAALLAGASADGWLAPDLFAVGWFRRGPRGAIPENRADAQAVAQAMATGLRDGGKPGGAALRARRGQATDYAGWTRIDAAEIAAAAPGRVRRKIRERAELLRLARQDKGEDA